MTSAGGRPVDGVVVNDDKLSIRAPADIEFETCRAGPQRFLERTDGVFRCPWISWRATVSEDDHDSSLRFGRAWDKFAGYRRRNGEPRV